MCAKYDFSINVEKKGKYGENDNFAAIANRAKHKAMRGPIKVGDTGKFGKYGENDNFAKIANVYPSGVNAAQTTLSLPTNFNTHSINQNRIFYSPKTSIDLLDSITKLLTPSRPRKPYKE